MKIFAPTLLFLLLLNGCSDKKELEGFWYGQRELKGSLVTEIHPKLLKFNDKTLIDYFLYYDTIDYKQFINRIYITTRNPKEKYSFKYKLTDSVLKLYFPDTKELYATLKKKSKNNFLEDYISDKTLLFDLPTGKVTESNYREVSFYTEPLYLTYKKGKLISHFRNKTELVDNSFYKYLLHNTYKDFNTYGFKPSISLIADKNVTITDLSLLHLQIQLADYENIKYILKSSSYDTEKSYSIQLQRLSYEEEEPFLSEKKEILKELDLRFNMELDSINKLRKDNVYSTNYKDLGLEELPYHETEFDLEHSILLKIDKSNLTVNNSPITKSELEKIIKNKLERDSKFFISYYITDESVYQNFIDFLDISYKVALDLQDKYLREKFVPEKESRRYNHEYRERIQEAKFKYPFSIWSINEMKYNELVKNFE